jgi:hypothetical protein
MDCRGGACLGALGVPQSNFCTRACQSAADCPGGYSCSNVNHQGRFCVNVDATPRCAKDANCWYGTICEVLRGRCLGDRRTDRSDVLYSPRR